MLIEGGSAQNVESYQSSEWGRARARKMLDRMNVLTQYVNREDGVNMLSDLIDQDAFFVVASNHTHHGNVAAFERVWKSLPVRPERANIVTAYSLTNGGQKQELIDGAVAIRDLLRPQGLDFVEVVRPKDIEQFRADGATEEEIAEIAKKSKRNFELILNSVGEDSGLFIFPAGTTEEAVRDENGLRPGLKPVDNSLMSHVFGRAKRIGREVAVLPMAHVNTFRIVEPRTTSPSFAAKFGIGMDTLYLPAPKLAQVVIGQPFTLSDMSEAGVNVRDNAAVNDFVMRKIARYMPVEARGHYR